MNRQNMDFRNYPVLLDVPQLAEILGISTKTAYKVLARGDIACVKVGRQYKIPKANLLKYLCVAK